MTTETNITYVEAEDIQGQVYICPLNVVSNQARITDQEAASGVEKEVVGGYAGNLFA